MVLAYRIAIQTLLTERLHEKQPRQRTDLTFVEYHLRLSSSATRVADGQGKLKRIHSNARVFSQ